MIRRLNSTTLIELSGPTQNISWNIILTDKARRDIRLSSIHLKRIRQWEKEFASKQSKSSKNATKKDK
jgi:hypothetical protein